MPTVNQICHPDERVAGDHHKHECQSCGTCWKHGNDCAEGTAEEFDEAHECPKCGETQTMKLIKTDADRKAAECAFFNRIFGGF